MRLWLAEGLSRRLSFPLCKGPPSRREPRTAPRHSALRTISSPHRTSHHDTTTPLHRCTAVPPRQNTAAPPRGRAPLHRPTSTSHHYTAATGQPRHHTPARTAPHRAKLHTTQLHHQPPPPPPRKHTTPPPHHASTPPPPDNPAATALFSLVVWVPSLRLNHHWFRLLLSARYRRVTSSMLLVIMTLLRRCVPSGRQRERDRGVRHPIECPCCSVLLARYRMLSWRRVPMTLVG